MNPLQAMIRARMVERHCSALAPTGKEPWPLTLVSPKEIVCFRCFQQPIAACWNPT